MQRIQLETVLNTVQTTQTVIQGVKTVCQNHDQLTSHISNEQLKRNINNTAQQMYVFIDTCEKYVDETIQQVKNRFSKLMEDVGILNNRYGQMIDSLNKWLNIAEIEKEYYQQVNDELNGIAAEFPSNSRYYKGSLVDRINLYIIAISKKLEELIQALYDQVKEWVEIIIQKLKAFIDPYLKQLKAFGDNIVQIAKEWMGAALDYVNNSAVGEFVKTGAELAKGVLEAYPEVGKVVEELIPSDISFDFAGGDLLDGLLGGKSKEEQQKEDQIQQKIVVPKEGEEKEGTFSEGIFTGDDDPRSAKYDAPDGLGIKETDAGAGQLFEVPTTQFNAEYTKNFPMQTAGGHIQEFDDTPGHERYFISHPAGTSSEVQPDGSRVNRISGQDFTVIEHNGNIQISGTCNIIIGGDARIQVGGDAYTVVNGNQATTVKGNAAQTVFGNLEQQVNGNVLENIKGNVKQLIQGQVEQNVVGDLNQMITGNSWQQVHGNSQLNVKGTQYSVIDGDAKQQIQGNVIQNINGTSSQKVQGQVVQDVQGDVTQNIQANMKQTISGNLDFNVSGNVKLKSGGNFDIQSGGSTTVNSSGQNTFQQSGETTITGSRVSLN